MNILDFNSLSHFTGRRSGSAKKSDSNSGKKIIRKRKNLEKFLLNKKKIRSNQIKDALPRYEKYKNWEDINEKGIKELREKWRKRYKKKLREDFNKNSNYEIETLNQKKQKRKKIHRFRGMFAAKILTSLFQDLEANEIYDKFQNKYINRLPNNIDDFEKWRVVGQANEMVKELVDNRFEYNQENWGWVKKTYKKTKRWIKKKAPGFSVVSGGPWWFKFIPRWVQRKILRLKNSVSSAVNRIKNSVNRVKNSITNKINQFRNKINELANLVRNAPRRIMSSVTNVMNNVKRSVSNTVNSVKNSIRSRVNSLSGVVGNKLRNIVNLGNIAGSISGKVSGITSSVKNSIGGIISGLRRTVSSVASKSSNFVKNMGKNVSSAFRKVWNTVSGAIKKAGKNVSNSIKKALKGIKKVAKSAFDFVKNGIKKLTKHMKKFVGTGWTFIKNNAKKAFGFFKRLLVKIWKWFKKIMTRLFSFLKTLFGGKNIVAKILRFLIKVTLVLLLGPPGQMVARIKYLNGTLDKWWLLIPPLSIFPLSIAPTIMFMQNKIEKGVEDELPYDGFINIVMLLGITLPALELVFDTDLFFALYAIYVFGVWFLVYSMRDKKKCKQVRGREDGWQFGKFLKSASMSALSFVILRDIMSFVFKGMSYLPVVGIPFKIINKMPFANVAASSSSAAAIVYILVNMLNNTPNNKYCNDYTTKKGLHTAFRSIGSLVIYFLAYSMIAGVKDLVI